MNASEIKKVLQSMHEIAMAGYNDYLSPEVIVIYPDGSGTLGNNANAAAFYNLDQLALLIAEKMRDNGEKNVSPADKTGD